MPTSNIYIKRGSKTSALEDLLGTYPNALNSDYNLGEGSSLPPLFTDLTSLSQKLANVKIYYDGSDSTDFCFLKNQTISNIDSTYGCGAPLSLLEEASKKNYKFISNETIYRIPTIVSSPILPPVYVKDTSKSRGGYAISNTIKNLADYSCYQYMRSVTCTGSPTLRLRVFNYSDTGRRVLEIYEDDRFSVTYSLNLELPYNFFIQGVGGGAEAYTSFFGLKSYHSPAQSGGGSYALFYFSPNYANVEYPFSIYLKAGLAYPASHRMGEDLTIDIENEAFEKRCSILKIVNDETNSVVLSLKIEGGHYDVNRQTRSSGGRALTVNSSEQSILSNHGIKFLKSIAGTSGGFISRNNGTITFPEVRFNNSENFSNRYIPSESVRIISQNFVRGMGIGDFFKSSFQNGLSASERSLYDQLKNYINNGKSSANEPEFSSFGGLSPVSTYYPYYRSGNLDIGVTGYGHALTYGTDSSSSNNSYQTSDVIRATGGIFQVYFRRKSTATSD